MKHRYLLTLVSALSISFAAIAGPNIKGKAGEDVVFKLNGKANTVLFYSGEKGCSYEYCCKDRFVPHRMVLSFETQYAKGKQYEPLRIKYSTNYNGKNTENDIRSAKWVDITDRCNLPYQIKDTDGEDIKPTKSGNIDITDCFPDDGSPVYLCLFYTVRPFDKSAWNSRTMVSVKDLSVNADAEGIVRSAFLASKTNVALITGSTYQEDESRPTFGGKEGHVSIRFTSEYKPSKQKHAFAVTSPIVKPSPYNMGPDEAMTIKDKAATMPENITHKYNKPGIYNAVIIYIDENGKEKVQNYTVTIR